MLITADVVTAFVVSVTIVTDTTKAVTSRTPKGRLKLKQYRQTYDLVIKNPLLLLPLLVASILPTLFSIFFVGTESVFLTFVGRLRLIIPSLPSLDNHAELIPLLVNLFLSSFPSDQNILILPFSMLIYLLGYPLVCIILKDLILPPTASRTLFQKFLDMFPSFVIFVISYPVFWILYFIITGVVSLPVVAFFYLIPSPVSLILGYSLYATFFIFGLYLWARSSFWLALMICEKQSIVFALKNSFRLTRESWLKIIPMSLLNFGIFSILSIVTGMIPKAGPVFSAAFSAVGLTIQTGFLFLLCAESIPTTLMQSTSPEEKI